MMIMMMMTIAITIAMMTLMINSGLVITVMSYSSGLHGNDAGTASTIMNQPNDIYNDKNDASNDCY